MKNVPTRPPDASKEFQGHNCNVWFEELIIQRSDQFPYAEPMHVRNNLLCFGLNHVTGQQTHAAKWIQEAYRNWVADKELLG